MASKDFDCAEAWLRLASPAIKNLHTAQKEALNKIVPQLRDLQQGRDLNIKIPSDVRAELNKLTVKELAILSRSCYFIGHWQPSEWNKPAWNKGHGEGWKVANVCDQMLREKIDLPSNIEIHEGQFRVTFSSKDEWTWEEFGLATEKNVETFKTCGLSFGSSTLHKSAHKLAVLCGDLWDTEPFMKFPKDSKEAAFQELLVEDSPFVLENFTTINHQPHPYVIGTAHINASNGILDERAIREAERRGDGCYYREGGQRCTLSYDEHTSEKAIMLKLIRNVNGEELKPFLKPLLPFLEAEKFTGLAFNVNGFTIAQTIKEGAQT